MTAGRLSWQLAVVGVVMRRCRMSRRDPMYLFPPRPADLSRRRFVQGMALGGAVAGLGLLRSSNVWALTSPGQAAVLSGTDFALDIAETPVNYTGASRLATTVNGGIPGPILRWKEGTTVNLRVTNRLH